MIRVGFVFSFTDVSWLGGLNYFRNLLTSIHSLPDRKIEPVLFLGKNTDLELIKDFPPLETVQTHLLDHFRPEWVARKSYQYAFSHDSFLERLLVKHGIAVLSHSGTLGENSKLPTLNWIPDFQHRHLPDFFSREETKKRDRWFKELCARSTSVLLSSETARADLASIDAAAAAKSKVLRFVALPNGNAAAASLSLLQERYEFRGPYFHLPNQFWVHKNHRVVIKALQILKSRKRNVLILATGNTHDHRQPGHFKDLMAYADQAGVRDCFRVLGMVSRAELSGLMVHAVALINPSLYEGWSTTVEEAKSLGKRVILSDIQVHKEQAPAHGSYFDPNDPETLASVMWKLWSNHDKAADERLMQQASEILPTRRKEFARTYEKIVTEALEGQNENLIKAPRKV